MQVKIHNQMTVLDVCYGMGKMYGGMQFNLEDDFLFIDRRKEDSVQVRKGRYQPDHVVVKPMVLADMRCLPFKSESIHHIVCDPPHLKTSMNSFMGRWYGSWSREEAQATMEIANVEFFRVLKPKGSLILKIMSDRKDLYLETLTNFNFFLEIPTIRRNGCQKPKEGAIWFIGEKKGVS